MSPCVLVFEIDDQGRHQEQCEQRDRYVLKKAQSLLPTDSAAVVDDLRVDLRPSAKCN
jgi:hypothetical protein